MIATAVMASAYIITMAAIAAGTGFLLTTTIGNHVGHPMLDPVETLTRDMQGSTSLDIRTYQYSTPT